MPAANTGSVSSMAAHFEKNAKRRTPTNNAADPTFGNMELYDTMVVHYDKENNSVPDMVQRAKKDELMRKGLRINKTQTAKQKRMEERRRSEPRPASQNPNYQYNKTIDVKRKSVDGHLDHKKAQAQERV